jgi:O-antigen/teichoic acid export membrane protein
LLRNFVIARMIMPQDFGVAVTFATTVSLLNLISDLGMDKFIVQDRDGDDPSVQASLHAMIVARGVATSAILFLCAGPIASLFGVPGATASYRWLALAPLTLGFAHLDTIRAFRGLMFARDAVANFVSQGIGVAVALGLVVVMRDYRPMLWGLIVQCALYALATHLLSNRRYQISFKGGHIGRLLDFSWPLIVNGIVLFAANQGDRVAIGSLLGVRELAIYGAPTLLSSALSMVLIRVLGSLALPVLAGLRDDAGEFDRVHHLIGAVIGAGALLVSLPFMFLGPDITGLLYGKAYVGPQALFIFVGAGLALYVAGYWATLASQSLGDTRNLMMVNIARVLGFGLVVPFLLFAHVGLVAVAGFMAFGQLLGVTVGFLRLRRVLKRVTPGEYNGILSFLAVLAAAVLLSYAVAGWPLLLRLPLCMAFALGSLSLLIALTRDYRALFTAGLEKLRSELGARA